MKWERVQLMERYFQPFIEQYDFEEDSTKEASMSLWVNPHCRVNLFLGDRNLPTITFNRPEINDLTGYYFFHFRKVLPDQSPILPPVSPESMQFAEPEIEEQVVRYINLIDRYLRPVFAGEFDWNLLNNQ